MSRSNTIVCGSLAADGNVTVYLRRTMGWTGLSDDGASCVTCSGRLSDTYRLATSIGADPCENDPHGPREDLRIQEERPVPDVIYIVSHDALVAQIAPTGDLP